MVLPKTLRLLHYDTALESLSKYFIAKASVEYAQHNRPCVDRIQIEQIHQQVKDFHRAYSERLLTQVSPVGQIAHMVYHTKKRLLDMDELSDMCTSLQSIALCARWADDTNYAMLSYNMVPHLLLERLKGIFGTDGILRRENIASLRDLDKRMASLHKKRQRVSSQFIESNKDICAGTVSTIRDGRLVIPLRASFKNKIAGIIHGVSATAQTAFVEIEQLYEYNNEIATLSLQEEKILLGIRKECSEAIHRTHDTLLRLHQQFVLFDMIQAQYHYGKELHGIFPHIPDTEESIPALHAHTPTPPTEYCMLLKDARHPFIEHCAPITIAFASNTTQLILTGANAGGKTVALKTLGLLVLLHQSGIPIPVADGSILPLFSHIAAVMGDNQDIVKGESTFSSHMQEIKTVMDTTLQNANTLPSLVLFDEFCDGTDDREGGALAWAMLEHMNAHTNTFVIVTTHLTLLKQYAITHTYAEIASVHVNNERTQYQILYGSPGVSEADVVAARVGIFSDIITRQQHLLQEHGREYQDYLVTLQNKLVHIGSLETALEHDRLKQASLASQVAEREQSVQTREIALKEKEKQEASVLLTQMRSVMAMLQKNQQTTDIPALQANIDTFSQSIADIAYEIDTAIQANVRTLSPLSVGDEVYIQETGATGVVMSTQKHDKYMVRSGIITLTLSREKLQAVAPKDSPSYAQKISSSIHIEHGEKTKRVLDVRGLTTEDALAKVMTYIETVVMRNNASCAIIHGKGEGILSRAIHTMLDEHPLVKHKAFATPDDGGHGKTYVYFE